MISKCQILNRDFQHPADGWYQIEAKGEHPNARAGVVQIIDDTALASIAKRFNTQAAKPDFAGMLIDHEHFKHDEDKETIAYGWLMQLENRADGLYGQIRWTGTGKKAVDDGDYRFFSTEYDAKDLEILNSGKPKKVRPLALDGLTLTNVNNNKGQKPITNRKMNTDPTDIETAIDTETSTETPVPGGRMDAVRASRNAADASEKADSPAQHENAAVLHRKAEKAQRAVGHDATANYHKDMADAHDRTAASIRSGAQNCAATNRETGNPASAPAQNPNGSGQARLLATQLAAATGKPFAECWQTIRNAHPELFSVRNRADKARNDSARAADRANLELERQDQLAPERNHTRRPVRPQSAGFDRTVEIGKYRTAHPRVSFDQAWQAVKAERPELFAA